MSALARSGTGRRRRRFSAMLHARPSGLALTTVALVVAAIVGIQLGQSAISEINPIHFQGALERPEGITPPPEPAPYNPYAQDYVWSASPQTSMVDCLDDCDGGQARRAMNYALEQAAGREALPYWRDATPTTELRPWQPGATPERNRIERYMHYPVSSEQAAAPPVPEGPAAEALRPPPLQAQGVEPETVQAQPVVEN